MEAEELQRELERRRAEVAELTGKIADSSAPMDAEELGAHWTSPGAALATLAVSGESGCQGRVGSRRPLAVGRVDRLHLPRCACETPSVQAGSWPRGVRPQFVQKEERDRET